MCINKLKLVALKNQPAFDIVNKLGRKFRTPLFTFISCAAPESFANEYGSDSLFLGFKINRKFGDAVVRNKVRRRLKAIMREHVTTSVEYASSMFIIIPFREAIAATYQDLELAASDALASHLKRRLHSGKESG